MVHTSLPPEAISGTPCVPVGDRPAKDRPWFLIGARALASAAASLRLEATYDRVFDCQLATRFSSTADTKIARNSPLSTAVKKFTIASGLAFQIRSACRHQFRRADKAYHIAGVNWRGDVSRGWGTCRYCPACDSGIPEWRVDDRALHSINIVDSAGKAKKPRSDLTGAFV